MSVRELGARMEKGKENFDFPERPIGRLFSEIASPLDLNSRPRQDPTRPNSLQKPEAHSQVGRWMGGVSFLRILGLHPERVDSCQVFRLRNSFSID